MNPTTSMYSSLIMIVIVFAMMYFMVLRPQQKKEKETKQMRDALKAGDEIVTIGGFYGKVLRVKEESIVIVCGADKTKLEIAKWGVSQVINASDAPAEKKETKESDDEPRKASPKNIKKLGSEKREAEAAEPEVKSEE